MSYKEALKIHGYEFSDESSSGEDSKSVLDEDYYRLQPSPIPVRRLNHRIIKINVGDKTQQKRAFNKPNCAVGVSLQQNTINKRKNNHKSKFARKSTSSANSNCVNTNNQINSCTFTNKYHTSNSALYNTTVRSRPAFGNSSNQNLNRQESFKPPIVQFKRPTEIVITPTRGAENQNRNAIQTNNSTFKELHSKEIRRHTRFSTTETPSSSTNDVNVSKNITARVFDNKTRSPSNDNRKYNVQIATEPPNISNSKYASCKNEPEVPILDQASRTSHSFVFDGQFLTDVVCEPVLQSITNTSPSTNQEVSQVRNQEELQHASDSNCMNNIFSVLFCCCC